MNELRLSSFHSHKIASYTRFLNFLERKSNLLIRLKLLFRMLCHNIQYLYITFEKVISTGLTDLISAQESLKTLYMMQSYDCENLTDVIHSLTKLPDTLIKLELYGGKHYIPLSFI